MRVPSEPAFVLHRRPYSESSLLLDLFTSRYGRLTVLAKGARRLKSKTRGLVHPFQPLLLGWSGKGELPTLTGAEQLEVPVRLPVASLMCGYYLNELLIRLLHRHDPHENLFGAYARALGELGTSDDVERALRIFEKHLLREIGYALVLERTAVAVEVRAGSQYRYVPELGVMEHTRSADGIPISGVALLALGRELVFDATVRRETKRLTRGILIRYLDGKPLRTRQLFRQLTTGPHALLTERDHSHQNVDDESRPAARRIA